MIEATSVYKRVFRYQIRKQCKMKKKIRQNGKSLILMVFKSSTHDTIIKLHEVGKLYQTLIKLKHRIIRSHEHDNTLICFRLIFFINLSFKLHSCYYTNKTENTNVSNLICVISAEKVSMIKFNVILYIHFVETVDLISHWNCSSSESQVPKITLVNFSLACIHK